MSDAHPGIPQTSSVLKTAIAACLGCGLLVSLALSLWITQLNRPLRTLPDLLVVTLYLSVVYGLASLALGTGIAVGLRFLWPGKFGRRWKQADIPSLTVAGFVGFGIFVYLGSWWRYQIAIDGGGSFFAPLALAKLTALAAVAIVGGWLVYRLHRKLRARLTRYRWVILLGLLVLVGGWLVSFRYALGISAAAADPPAESFRVERTGTKVLLLAVDGATWKTLDPLLRAGRLPTLERLVENGASGPLSTFEPTESPLIWTSIATGMTPQKHGIRDYVVTKIPGLNPSYLFSTVEASYPRFTGVRLAIAFANKLGLIETLPVTSDLRREKTLWNILGEAGFTVGVNSWWATWPAEKVNGYLVSEYVSVTPEAHAQSIEVTPGALTYPQELYEEIRPLLKSLGDKMDREEVDRFASLTEAEFETLNGPYQSDEPLSNFKWIYHRDANAYESEMLLMQRFQPGFSTVYLRGLDIISHLFWQFVEPEHFEQVNPEDQARFGPLLDNYTMLVDSVIGELLDLIDDDTTVFVVSDHGMEATGETPLSGSHPSAPDGIVIISGKNIRPTRLDNVSVLDIAPTILHLMGLPVSRQMDGRVVTEMMDAAFVSLHPVREIDSYGSRNTGDTKPLAARSREEIEQRLKALGYLD
ncbi:MAG: alkaline phosphatase family protein [Acidobacteriota bacterium]|nr:alkaline phosphatase family protein [Acidobacteriota bacterium]